MIDAFILAGARTPIGKFLGIFQGVPATGLGSIAIRASLMRRIAPAQSRRSDHGNVLSAGPGSGPRTAGGVEAEAPRRGRRITVNKVCGSGLKAVMLAHQAIRAAMPRSSAWRAAWKA